jgi:CBS domain-containing protein
MGDMAGNTVGLYINAAERPLARFCRSKNVRVEDFMTRRVITITPDTTLFVAAKLMLEHRVGGFPVVDAAGRMIGVFSESDLLREESTDEDRSPWLKMMVGPDGKPTAPPRLDARNVGDFMTPQPITIAPNASIAQACRLLHEHGLRRLPVVEGDKLVGMIARADLVRAIAESSEKASSTALRDVSVDARLAEMERQLCYNRGRVVRPF